MRRPLALPWTRTPGSGIGWASGSSWALPRSVALTVSVASVVLLIAVAASYATVVGARLLGYAVVVPENGGETTAAGHVLFVRQLPLTDAHEGQTILVRDAEHGRATIELERIVSLRGVEGALLAETERVGDPAERRTSVLTGALLVPGGSVPQLGYPVGGLTNPLGWLLSLVLPAVWLAGSLLKRIWRGSRHPDRSPLRGISGTEPRADEPPVKRPLFGVDPLKETP